MGFRSTACFRHHFVRWTHTEPLKRAITIILTMAAAKKKKKIYIYICTLGKNLG